ncbi:MAG: hypothetical protein HDR20_12165 [Lachnospiraceae bacterium]|nr:hypothetical protein [Lachnospiraceae bacterium]
MIGGNQDGHVLEIGMGTGKATQTFLDTHCHFVGIEPGENHPVEFSNADAKRLADKALAYGFGDVKHMLYHAAKDFTADEYISLLRTYPDHMKLESAACEKLFEGIFHAIVDNGGTMTVYYTMDLELARK